MAMFCVCLHSESGHCLPITLNILGNMMPVINVALKNRLPVPLATAFFLNEKSTFSYHRRPLVIAMTLYSGLLLMSKALNTTSLHLVEHNID